MEKNNFTNLISFFNDQLVSAEHYLIKLIDIIKEGRVPSSEAMDDLNDCVESIHNTYDEIYTMARDAIPTEELPPNGSSVSKIMEAVENNRSRYIGNLLNRTKEILTKFIGIRSANDAYATILEPYQNAAAKLLRQIDENTVEKLLPKTEPYEMFVQTMESEDIRNQAGFALFDKMYPYYPDPKIFVGLGAKLFYIDSRPSVSPLPAASKIDNVPEEAAPDSQQTSAPATPQANTDQGPANITPNPEAEEEEATTALVLNKVKTGTPNVSAFKKEIAKLSRIYPEIRGILPLFTNLGVMTETQIGTIGICMDAFENGKSFEDFQGRIHTAIDALVNKGYLAKFIDETDCDVNNGAPTLYCLSDYCCGCMQKESIRQSQIIFSISIGGIKFSANTAVDLDDARRFYFNNLILMQYFVQQKEMLSNEKYRRIKQSVKWREDHYQIGFYDGETLQSAYVTLLPHRDEEKVEKDDLSNINAKYIMIGRWNLIRDILFHPCCEKVLVIGGKESYICDPGRSLLEQIESGHADIMNAAPEADYMDEPEAKPAEDLTGDDVPGDERTDDATEALAEDDALGDVWEDNVSSTEEPASPAAAKNEDESAEAVPESVPTEPPERESPSEDSNRPLTPQTLLEMKQIPSDAAFCQVIHELLSVEVPDKELTRTIVNAVLLAKGAGLAEDRPDSKLLSAQLRLATSLMLDECSYSSEFLTTVFSDVEIDVPSLTLSAYMYALLTPSVMYDYGLQAQTEQYLSNFDNYFEGLKPFKALFNKLLNVRDVKASGFTPAVIALLGSEAESEQFMAVLHREASENLTVKTPKTRMKALPIMYNSEFGIGSDFRPCMEIIAQGKTDEESLEWVEMVLSDYCEVIDGEYRIDEDKIEDRLNRAWADANSKSRFKLEYDARDQALKQYRQRLSVMIKWTEHIRNRMDNKQDIERLKYLRRDILNLIADIRRDSSWRTVKDANVLAWLLSHMGNYLLGSVSDIDIYSDLLYTGVFSLSEEGIPEIDASLGNLKYYEVWRNALRHIVAPRKSVDAIIAEILGETPNGEAGLKDNLRQLSLLGRVTGDNDEVFTVSEGQLKEAASSANIYTDRFRDTLELAYTYYQINETEKENLSYIMNQFKSAFYEIGDFAAWRRFLEALEMQIREFSNGRKIGLRSRLNDLLEKDGRERDNSKEEKNKSTLLIEAERLLEEESNFSVTEEYLNRYENGERELDNTYSADNDYFSEFLDPHVFDPLYQVCARNNGRSLRTFGWNYIERNLPRDWTGRQRDDSKQLVSSWPVRKDTETPDQAQKLLKGLGINAISASKVTGRREEIWQLIVRPTARSLADYLHPIAAFGTQMKSPLQIIFLYGNYTEQQLVDTVTSMNLGTMSIVFIDRPLEISRRRYIGEIFHRQKSGQNPFLLVDQVLFLYLAMHQETERLPALLKCTLPYATYQPFVRDGGSTADEMFCGRILELATIIDPNGACVVYGGRQLGKTALLERAESRCSKPENKAYAVYSTIIRQKKEAEVVETLVSDINRKTDGKICLKPCGTIREMCSQLRDLFRARQIVSMHLLIDEVDDFLGAIADIAYKPLQPLVDLKRETKNNFKFVVAGLHNVCRAKSATKDNGIFGQLGTPLCIKPLSPTDALQLLSKPLRYLGFQIDRYPHLETILTNTNYYPGILQFFGYILVETLTGQYSKYYRAADGHPPFTLHDEQLGAVMNSADLNKSIKDKFRWSLELDPRYFMIARCITLLYHLFEDDRASGCWRGFSVDDIMEIAKDYHIHCLENVSKTEYIILMDEMVEMGILGKTDENGNTYRLRRSSFVDSIGETLDAVEADIINSNEEN